MNVIKEPFVERGVAEDVVDFDARLGICWVNDCRMVKLDDSGEPIVDCEKVDGLDIGIDSSLFIQALRDKLKRS